MKQLLYILAVAATMLCGCVSVDTDDMDDPGRGDARFDHDSKSDF